MNITKNSSPKKVAPLLVRAVQDEQVTLKIKPLRISCWLTEVSNFLTMRKSGDPKKQSKTKRRLVAEEDPQHLDDVGIIRLIRQCAG